MGRQVNPNVTVFNTRGLRSIQISRNSPDRIGRVDVEKDAAGEPTGRLLGPVNLGRPGRIAGLV